MKRARRVRITPRNLNFPWQFALRLALLFGTVLLASEMTYPQPPAAVRNNGDANVQQYLGITEGVSPAIVSPLQLSGTDRETLEMSAAKIRRAAVQLWSAVRKEKASGGHASKNAMQIHRFAAAARYNKQHRDHPAKAAQLSQCNQSVRDCFYRFLRLTTSDTLRDSLSPFRSQVRLELFGEPGNPKTSYGLRIQAGPWVVCVFQNDQSLSLAPIFFHGREDQMPPWLMQWHHAGRSFGKCLDEDQIATATLRQRKPVPGDLQAGRGYDNRRLWMTGECGCEYDESQLGKFLILVRQGLVVYPPEYRDWMLQHCRKQIDDSYFAVIVEGAAGDETKRPDLMDPQLPFYFRVHSKVLFWESNARVGKDAGNANAVSVVLRLANAMDYGAARWITARETRSILQPEE